MLGISLKLFKKNPSLIPLFAVVGLGVVGAVFYTARVAILNPEIKLIKRDVEPWDEWKNKQYKLYSPKLAEKDHISQAPEY